MIQNRKVNQWYTTKLWSTPMDKVVTYQQKLFNPEPTFPSTRYQGSKTKIVNWLWDKVNTLHFNTVLDIFGGTGAVAYKFKLQGKQVTYNDLLKFNYYFGVALIENVNVKLEASEVAWLLQKHSEIKYPQLIESHFSGIYFTDTENAWIDQTITNIRCITNPYKFAIAFYALCQACLIKRPYNLFHRKNLYIRFAEVDRSFGNKSTWDKPFDDLFKIFVDEANRAVFDNGQQNYAYNFDAINAPTNFDLVYIDTPYISNRGTAVDYLGFYHFLEGLTMYDSWNKQIDERSKHKRLMLRPNEWIDKNLIYGAFDKIFQRYRNSIMVVSYRSDGIPSESELINILYRYKKNIRVEYYGKYQYVLSTNNRSQEILIIAT
ncbi:MAG: DNA adenine methylase [Acidobacteriota bacterium]